MKRDICVRYRLCTPHLCRGEYMMDVEYLMYCTLNGLTFYLYHRVDGAQREFYYYEGGQLIRYKEGVTT